jgi:hypothetical protein
MICRLSKLAAIDHQWHQLCPSLQPTEAVHKVIKVAQVYWVGARNSRLKGPDSPPSSHGLNHAHLRCSVHLRRFLSRHKRPHVDRVSRNGRVQMLRVLTRSPCLRVPTMHLPLTRFARVVHCPIEATFNRRTNVHVEVVIARGTRTRAGSLRHHNVRGRARSRSHNQRNSRRERQAARLRYIDSTTQRLAWGPTEMKKADIRLRTLRQPEPRRKCEGEGSWRIRNRKTRLITTTTTTRTTMMKMARTMTDVGTPWCQTDGGTRCRRSKLPIGILWCLGTGTGTGTGTLSFRVQARIETRCGRHRH